MVSEPASYRFAKMEAASDAMGGFARNFVDPRDPACCIHRILVELSLVA
jgi:hypothetical protein